LLEEALAATRGESSVTRVRLLAHLCGALYYSHRRDEMLPLSVEAAALASALGDPAARAYAASARHRAMWSPERLADRLDAAGELAAAGREAGRPELALQGRGWLVVDELERGDIAAAEEQMAAFEDEAERLRMPLYRWNVAVWHAMRALLRGELDTAEPLAQRALEIGARAESVTAPHYFAIQVLWLRREQGRAGELEAAARDFVERFPALPAWGAALAAILCEEGRLDEARAELDRLAAKGFADIPHDGNWLVCVTLLCEACDRLADAERARLLYDLLLPHADTTIVIALAAVCTGSAQRYLGMMAATAGRLDEAVGHLELAVERNAALGSPPLVARARADLARAIERRDGLSPGSAPRP
jgi:tetratricopeptide (TPR) repeat protein